MSTRQCTGMHGLIEDASPHLRLERVASDEVDAPSQQLLQASTQPRELKERHGTVELHEHVDIAVGAQLPARRRAEHPESTHGMRAQFWKMTSQDGKDLGGIGHGVAVPIVPLALEPSGPALSPVRRREPAPASSPMPPQLGRIQEYWGERECTGEN